MTCTQRVSIDGINHCYNQAVADKCCGTCKQLWSSTASQNCPYGDKILINGYCQNIRCTGVYKENCCSVCGSVNSGYRISIDFIINSMFSVIVPLHSAYVMIGV
ncbi:hypothetical protein Btru_076135 [Bulinus truncatus]|nr:hypothetical protein Btru_076135 [Bulinus truncatus]